MMKLIEILFGQKCAECGQRIKGQKFSALGPGWLCQSCNSKLEEQRRRKEEEEHRQMEEKLKRQLGPSNLKIVTIPGLDGEQIRVVAGTAYLEEKGGLDVQVMAVCEDGRVRCVSKNFTFAEIIVDLINGKRNMQQ